MVLIPSTDVDFSNSKFKIAKEPFGTGTLIALEVNLPSKLNPVVSTPLQVPVLSTQIVKNPCNS